MPWVNASSVASAAHALDHLLTLHERHLSRVLQAYVAYFNTDRPHQGINQAIPEPPPSPPLGGLERGDMVVVPVLVGCIMPIAPRPKPEKGDGSLK